jgi:hypothetical protein
MPIEVVTQEENELDARYRAALHAVQSGIKMKMQLGWDGASPKHLRVGVDSAMVNDWALTELLIRKGLITRLEYFELLAEGAENEKQRLEEELSNRLGKTVTLG